MTDLKEYVDGLFRHQHLTPELQDFKDEILSNLLAKRDDLIAQGLDPETAMRRAEESLPAVEGLVDGNQLTDRCAYHLECKQTVLLHCVIFWILSLPLLFTRFAPFSYLGLLLTILSGAIYLLGQKQRTGDVVFLSVPACERRRRTAWIIWGLFFAVCLGITAVLTFGSDIWFGRPFSVRGPYQMANLAAQIYLPLLTIFVPITFGSFVKCLRRSRGGDGDGLEK